jgi:hypothetical protein
LRASAQNLADAETKLDLAAMVRAGVRNTTAVKFVYKGGRVSVSDAVTPSVKTEEALA